MSNELVKFERLPVSNTGELIQLGNLLAQSEMFGTKNPGDGLVIAATCFQEGISLLKFCETYHIIQGRPTMKSDTMLARFEELGGKYQILQRTADISECEMEFKGRKLRDCFTWAEAQTESYTKQKDGKTFKDNWSSPRRRMQMIWARLVSDMIRVICPAAIKGTYAPEELEDAIDITPTNSKPQKIAVKPEITGVMPAGRDSLFKHPTKKESDIIDSTDYSTCPFGSPEVKDKKWNDLPDDVLKFALDAKHPKKAPGHDEAIKAVLDERLRQTTNGDVQV